MKIKDYGYKNAHDIEGPDSEMTRSLVQARKDQGLTQKDLSKLTGITQSDLSKIENGIANPSVRTLKKLAEGLGKKLLIAFV